MPNGLTQCDCGVYCHHKFPEITTSTRANHRQDEEIMAIQAEMARDRNHNHRSRPPYRASRSSERETLSHSNLNRPHSGRNPGHGHRGYDHNAGADPHRHHRRFPQPPRTPRSPSIARPGSPPPSQPHRSSHSQGVAPAAVTAAVAPSPRPSRPDARTEKALQQMRSEIESRAALLPISLATLLVFSNNPADHPYQPERTLRPNSGKYRLQPSVRTNVPFLEHENRVWEILSLAHLLPPYPGKDALENIIFTELDRCDLEKERHWNVQRMQLDMQTIVVNNGAPHT